MEGNKRSYRSMVIDTRGRFLFHIRLFAQTLQEGTINLDMNNPEGCQPCFCFGLSKECREKQWNRGEVCTTYI